QTTFALLPKNKSKNRFKNILPYDHTRVVLSDDGDGNDYINACYIDCHSVPRKYIATQGPLAKTEGDFWRMMWETESSIIVMLTNLFENGKKKCQKYWPDFGAQRDFKQINVACTQEEVIGCFVKRTFTIKLSEGAYDVTQFHYTTWPDHNIPITTTGLHRLKQAVMEQHKKSGESKPIVVHCSAGAGRTGTFIAFDSLSMQMNDKPSINVFDTVVNLRMQRMDMVQTQNQYMFLHKLVAEVYMLGQTDIPMMSLESKTKELESARPGKKSGFATELEKLDSLHFNERSHKYATENNDKDAIISFDHSRLTPGINSESSYYNASFIEGYGQRGRVLIAAKGPTSNTTENFWYAVIANQVHTIVSLRSIDEEPEEHCFPTMDQPWGTHDLTVNLLNEKDIGNNIIKRSLLISQAQNADNLVCTFHQNFEIGFYQLTSWMADTVPNNANDVLELIKKAQESQNQHKGRILVYCNDGAGRTGAFLCILNLVERAKLEGRVDVLRVVKDMRDMRVGMLQSELLYRFVYYCMAEFVSTFDVYANFN
uniref:Tyrosine-protein phosphatase non-receptor type 20 n=1 Tax=Ciona savignyi TaxID=51511 RepID=H2YNY5_CIOSA